MQVVTFEKKADGEEVPLVTSPTFTKQLKHALCIYKLFTKAPEYSNPGYKGKLRELLQPAVENLSVFDMDQLCKGLKKFEDDWSICDEKPKPADKGDKAAANRQKGVESRRKNRHL